MSLTKKEKQEAVSSIEKILDGRKTIVFLNQRGLKAQEIYFLKQKLEGVKAKFKVIKKTLAAIAFKNKGIKFEKENYDDQLAMVVGYEDEVAPAKILLQNTKELKTMEILDGYIANDYLTKEQILTIAQLPSRQELLAKLLYLLNYPMSGLVNVMSGNIKGLVYALKAITDK